MRLDRYHFLKKKSYGNSYFTFLEIVILNFLIQPFEDERKSRAKDFERIFQSSRLWWIHLQKKGSFSSLNFTIFGRCNVIWKSKNVR